VGSRIVVPWAPMLEPEELRRLKVLESVGLESVEGQLGRCKVKTLEAGEVLLTMGAPARDEMYMILSGRLAVHLDGDLHSDAVAHLEAGETVGELSMLDRSPASAHVVATDKTRVLVVGEAAFWSLVDVSHDFTINLLVLLARRLRSNNSTVSFNIRLQREHKRNALVDAMTGLHNRRWLDESLSRFVGRFARGSLKLAVLMIDVDHFKRFNDTCGHPAGDAVLVMVARVLQTGFRPTDQVARFGGEEFTVILPDTDDVGARVAAERVRRKVSATAASHGDKPLPAVTVSIGGAILAPGDTASTLVARADAALYESKQGGRDRVTFQ
jgi:diguanylate cyclase (GGDEF)-like protein